MNLLAHCYLADHSRTSHAGQILGDVVKGRLDGRYDRAVETGIRLHRAIDAYSDAHAAHGRLRARFAPPLRRYAGILVDIGFDYSLARAWPRYSRLPLTDYARHVERRVLAQWPSNAPFSRVRIRGLAQTLAGYHRFSGIQRALDSVAARLRRRNPVAGALPAILAEQALFDHELAELMGALEQLADSSASAGQHPRRA